MIILHYHDYDVKFLLEEDLAYTCNICINFYWKRIYTYVCRKIACSIKTTLNIIVSIIWKWDLYFALRTFTYVYMLTSIETFFGKTREGGYVLHCVITPLGRVFWNRYAFAYMEETNVMIVEALVIVMTYNQHIWGMCP